MNVTQIKAVDYYPSVSTMLIDHWRRVDAEQFEAELQEIKRCHPDMNTVRLTHSFEAYQRSPKEYRKKYEERLAVCDAMGLKVICCIFNRWHDTYFDCGGTYLEQLIPDMSWAFENGYYERFLQDVCIEHADDDRVVLWETCSKPLGVFLREEEDTVMAMFYEKRWLRELYCYIKKCEVDQPVGISFREDYSADVIAHLVRCCDVVIRSPYYANAEKTEKLLAHSFENTGLPVVHVV